MVHRLTTTLLLLTTVSAQVFSSKTGRGHVWLNTTSGSELTTTSRDAEAQFRNVSDDMYGGVDDRDDELAEDEEGRTTGGVNLRNLLTSSIGFVCNGLALAALIRHKDFSLQFRIHMMSITVADLFVNVTMVVVSASRTALQQVSHVFCIMVMSLAFCSIHVNSPLVLALALDRMFAVFTPLKYKTQSHPALKAGLLVGLVLLLTSAMTSAAFIQGPRAGLSSCYAFNVLTDLGFVLPGILISTCTCATIAIYVALICKLTVCRRHTMAVHPSFVRSEVTRTDAERTRKVTVRSSVLVAWFCISYLPFGLYLLYVAISKTDRSAEVSTTRFIVLTLSPFLNAIVDPFIVFWNLGASGYITRAIRTWWRKGPPENPDSGTRNVELRGGRDVDSTLA